MKVQSFVSLLLLCSCAMYVAACSTSTQEKKPIIKSKSTQALTEKKLQSFHSAFTKKCDVDFSGHASMTQKESAKFLNKKGWLTINKRPLSGACFNMVSYGKLKKVLDSNGGKRFVGEKATSLTKSIAEQVTDQYFMALYPESFKPITTQEAKAYYKKNKVEFQMSDDVRLKSIIVHKGGRQTIKDGIKPSVIIQDISAALQKDPSQFDTFASKYNHVPVDHGRFSVIVNPIRQKYLKSMKVGEISKPVKVEHFGDVDGFVIFQKYIYEKGGVQTFEASESRIKDKLFLKMKEKLVEIKKQYDIKIVQDGYLCHDC